MTEKEALEILNNECEDISKVQIALRVARNSLEEIQSYRTIGTVEEFKALKEKEEQRKEWERRTVVCKKCGYKNLDKLPKVCPGCGAINK